MKTDVYYIVGTVMFAISLFAAIIWKSSEIISLSSRQIIYSGVSEDRHNGPVVEQKKDFLQKSDVQENNDMSLMDPMNPDPEAKFINPNNMWRQAERVRKMYGQ